MTARIQAGYKTNTFHTQSKLYSTAPPDVVNNHGNKKYNISIDVVFQYSLMMIYPRRRRQVTINYTGSQTGLAGEAYNQYISYVQ